MPQTFHISARAGVLLVALALFPGCVSVGQMSDKELTQAWKDCAATNMIGLHCAEVRQEAERRQNAAHAERREQRKVEEALEAQRAAEREREVARTLRLPAAGQSDKVLERAMLEAWLNDDPGGARMTGLRAVIVSRNFETIKHPLSGVILGRRWEGVVAIRRANGECFIAMNLFEQEFDGREYTRVDATEFAAAPVPGSAKLEHRIECGNVAE